MSTRESRLVIAPRPTRRDHLHGAWWPHTRSFDEIVPMLAQVSTRFADVHGIMLNRDEWSDVGVTGQHARIGKTKISWYGLDGPFEVGLFCGQGRRLTLLLLPPGTPEPIAAAATLLACSPGNALSGAETLFRARAEAAAAQP